MQKKLRFLNFKNKNGKRKTMRYHHINIKRANVFCGNGSNEKINRVIYLYYYIHTYIHMINQEKSRLRNIL